jgi:universal stress protein E
MGGCIAAFTMMTVTGKQEIDMESIDEILVVLGDDRGDAATVLGKARVLAAASGARVHAVRVVYEGIADLNASVIDASSDLKTFILQSEETLTEELVDAARQQIPGLDAVTLWNPRPWEGILHAAQQVGADLIIKGAGETGGLGSVIRTPDDWNLLRNSQVPVMLVKPRAWVDEPVVLCALDAFEERHDGLNRALLRSAAALAGALGGELHLVVAYPLFERWVGELGSLRDYDQLRREVEREIRDRVVRLAQEVGVDYKRLHADEGRAEFVISLLAENLSAEVVVVGTHARQGFKGLLLGNTAERLVHHLGTDLLTVHAPHSN